MSIKSIASSEETSSPLYIQYKEVCQNWEHFIVSKGGEIEGTYSASSYQMEGKVKVEKMWHVEIEKEAAPKGRKRISSTTPKAKESITLTTTIEDTDCEKFYIKNGVAKRGQSNHDFYRSILRLLMEEFSTSDIYEVYFEDDMLTFVIHFKNNRFNMFDAVLDYTYPALLED